MKSSTSKSLCLLLTFTVLPSIADEYPTLKLSGNIKLDYDSFDNNFLENSNNGDEKLELRRLRLSIESDFNQDWSAKLKVNANDGIEVKDAYVKYDAWDFANMTIGKQKEPFGLEQQISSRNLLLIERSMMSSAISPERSYGINLSSNKKLMNWQLGYFQNDEAEKTNAVTGRLTWAPWYNKNKNLVHIGASFSERSLHGNSFRINEKLEVNSADSLIEGAKINADTISQTGIEYIWQYNGFLNMAEWQHSNVTTTEGSEYQYEGGYYQISYLFSGKNREYKKGILGSVKTKKDWEIAMRYSQLNLLEENSEATVFSIGVNYLLNSDLKFMADYLSAENIDEGSSLNSGDAVSLRVFYRF